MPRWRYQRAALPHGLSPDTIGAVVYHAVHFLHLSELPKLQAACMPTVHPGNTQGVLKALVEEGHVLIIEDRYLLTVDLPRIAACMEEINSDIGAR